MMVFAGGSGHGHGRSLRLVHFLLLFTSFSAANIVFNWVQPSCNPDLTTWTGCLPGQQCLSNGTCVSAARQTSSSTLESKREGLASSSVTVRAYSPDARCGPRNGNLLCAPRSNVYTGTCCSKHGWCGDTEAYCGIGCISGCPNSSSSTVSDSSDHPNGHVNSEAGTQTSVAALGEPTLGQALPSISTSTPQSTGPITTNGTCGANYGNTVCGNWPKGSCCSMYGYCGNTTAHCGAGCQSGPCLGGSSIQAPGPSPAPMNSNPGSFKIVGNSGAAAMHAGLMENGRVVFLDKVEDYSPLNLTDGEWAYSSEYDPSTSSPVPLAYKTNAFCSGGSFLPDGRFLDVGGNAPLAFIDPTVSDGFTGIRYLQRSATDASYDGQSWSEPGNKLSSARWYASAQTMPDGTIFVASGSLNGLDPAVPANNNPTFEVLSSEGISNGQSIPMDILEKSQPYYMYPFMHVLSDGSLFVFVSKSSELFNVSSQTTIKQFSDLPGEYRTYPNTGGSVLLPLASSENWEPEVVICGGGAYQDITSPTDASCGSIRPLAADASWQMESMPEGRVMVEGILLPDGKVVWLNGCNQGAQGFGLGQDPTYEVLIYDPSQPVGSRFTKGASTNIPRLYHSVALLLPDGTIMIAGSNPNQQPVLTASPANPFITEYRVEIYTPPYLSTPGAEQQRPANITMSTSNLTANGQTFTVAFTSPSNAQNVSTVLYHGGFVTHSLHMSHRMIVLDNTNWQSSGARNATDGKDNNSRKAGPSTSLEKQQPGRHDMQDAKHTTSTAPSPTTTNTDRRSYQGKSTSDGRHASRSSNSHAAAAAAATADTDAGTATQQTLTVTMPPSSNIAPPGPYMFFVVVDDVPGIGQMVSVS